MNILERINRNKEAIEVGHQALRFINERADKLGWDEETLQQSVKEYNKRIADLKESME